VERSGAKRVVLQTTTCCASHGVVPSLEDVPEDMRAELVERTWSDDNRLMEAADAMMPEEDQARMVELSANGASSPAEREELEELEALRTAYGHITLRKARAAALLSIRGGKRLLADADAA
jgi:hypothetical protein